MLIRLAPATDNWYRNHFPVIMETNKSYYFNDKIYNKINRHEYEYPTIEYGQAIDDGGAGPHPFSLADKV